MLELQDIEFLMVALDKVPVTGVKASMKLNEVFIKLANWKKALEGNEGQPQGEPKVKPDEEVVQE